LSGALEKSKVSKNILKPSLLAKKLYENFDKRREAITKAAEDFFPRELDIFDGCTDPLAAPFSKAYGMTEGKRMSMKKGERLIVPPWVQWSKNRIKIDDPRRGRFEVPLFRTPKIGDGVTVECLKRRSIRMSLENAQWLVERGFAYRPKAGSAKI